MTRSPKFARSLVQQLRQRALDLPVQTVGPLVELDGADCDFNQQPKDDPNRWMLIQSGEFIRRGDSHYPVLPKRVIAFSVDVGGGCEPANFGLCLYPGVIEWHGKRIRTQLSGWRWSSFCKTQYASNPDCGGVSHFLRCHLSVVALLDCAKNLGIVSEVSDEGDYFTKRDAKALAQEVGEWNEMIAAGAAKLKDLIGDGLETPITAFPDFGHLEANGRSTRMGGRQRKAGRSESGRNP